MPRTGVTGRLTVWVVVSVVLAAVSMAWVADAAASPLVWSPPALIDTAPSGEAFGALSCPSATLCVAPDQEGGVATTTDPGGSEAWKVTRLTGYRTLTGAPGIDSLSCPSVSLCLGVDFGGVVYRTTDPTGGPGAWRRVVLPTDGTGPSISCPTSSLCVLAFSDLGVVYTTSDPTGGSGAWVRSAVPGSNGSESGVACASATFCAVAAGNGLVFTSTNPAGGGSTYVAHRVARCHGPHMARYHGNRLSDGDAVRGRRRQRRRSHEHQSGQHGAHLERPEHRSGHGPGRNRMPGLRDLHSGR